MCSNCYSSHIIQAHLIEQQAFTHSFPGSTAYYSDVKLWIPWWSLVELATSQDIQLQAFDTNRVKPYRKDASEPPTKLALAWIRFLGMRGYRKSFGNTWNAGEQVFQLLRSQQSWFCSRQDCRQQPEQDSVTTKKKGQGRVSLGIRVVGLVIVVCCCVLLCVVAVVGRNTSHCYRIQKSCRRTP